MSTQQQFADLNENIKLTEAQRDDAQTKYTGVCKTLHAHFYPDTEYDGDTKLLFGSYAEHTAIRPMSEDQDVDVLFKIPEETYQQYAAYQSGGQSALLQETRKVLSDSRYGLGEKPKAWGKVILVKTADGTHNVELLPAYEQADGTFIIPNSENGSSWDFFDPRTQLEQFRASNKQTDGLTGDLYRMAKRWAREASSVSIKSFQLKNFVMSFLATYGYSGKEYARIVADFFAYLLVIADADNRSYVETAKSRADKALAFEAEGKDEEATTEWKKVFGDSFPATGVEKSVGITLVQKIATLTVRYPSADEQFLDTDYNITFAIAPHYSISIDAQVTQNGFRTGWLSSFIRQRFLLLKSKKLVFSIRQNDVPSPFSVMWKVRNFGEEAQRANGLRGEISYDMGSHKKEERTLYYGEHYVECYIVKDGMCVARTQILVPIGNEYEQ